MSDATKLLEFEKSFLQAIVDTILDNGYMAKAKLSKDRTAVTVTFFEEGIWRDHVDTSWPVLLELSCMYGCSEVARNAGFSIIRMSGRELKEVEES